MNCVTYLVSVNIKYLGTIPLGGYLLTSTCWSNTVSDMQYYTVEGSMALILVSVFSFGNVVGLPKELVEANI